MLFHFAAAAAATGFIDGKLVTKRICHTIPLRLAQNMNCKIYFMLLCVCVYIGHNSKIKVTNLSIKLCWRQGVLYVCC